MESVIAEKYAAALLEAAKEQNTIEAVGRELREVRGMVEKTPELKSLLEHPRMNPLEKLKALEVLLSFNKVSPLMQRFLLLLMQKKRMKYFTAVADQYEKLQYLENGKTVVRVLTAMPLTPAQKTDLQERLSGLLMMKPEIREEVKPDLVGGMILFAGDQRLDASVLGQLERMRQIVMKEKE
jgi:F-type H+-transporting ATPase subunit delta